MFWPRKREWKDWDVLERVTYVAQLTAPLAFLATVGFSYLSWWEARHTQEIQERLFLAENGPGLTLRDVELLASDVPTLILVVENVGASTGSQVCVDVTVHDDSVARTRLGTTCSWPAYPSLRPKETFRYPFPLRERQIQALGSVVPAEARLLRSVAPGTGCTGAARVLLVSIRFQDVLENVHGELEQVLLCG